MAVSESNLHRTLVSALLSQIAREHGEVTHAVGTVTLDDPPAVGRHEPDVIAKGFGGTQILGEAKTGPDLFDERALEQFHDFTHHENEGDTAALVVIVPKGFREDALRALEQAGAATERASVIELTLPTT
jgi:hypothetical protein